MDEARSLLIVGVGGQGVVLASNIVAALPLRRGYDVKKSEVHGMAQRGGVVYSHIRYGPKVFSPLVERGCADVLLAFEWAEALRWLPYLRAEGILILDMVCTVPPIALRDRRNWISVYPSPDLSRLRRQGVDVRACNAGHLAEELGSRKVANTILLGVLANVLEFSDEEWEEAIAQGVPSHTVALNLQAFRLGRGLHFSQLTPEGPGSQEGRPFAESSRPRRFHLEIIEAWCKGCDICVRVCPEECLRLNHWGKVEVVNLQACTGCQLCQLLCPDLAITVHERECAEAHTTNSPRGGTHS